MTAPRITIGIPTRNRAKSLDRAIRCVCEQTFGDLELRISDNASTDDTGEIIRRWERDDTRISAQRQEVDIGPVGNFDRLRRGVESDYFLWLADDDEIDADYVASCIAFLDGHPNYVLAAGRPVLDNVEGNRKGTVVAGVHMDLSDEDPAARVLQYFEQVGDNSTFYGVSRIRALDRVPFHNTLAADWLVVAGLAAQGCVKTLEETTLRRPHRWGPDSIRHILSSHGLPPNWAKLPGWIVARGAFHDVVMRSPAYADLRRGQRLGLALRCARAICRHFHVGPMDVLRFYLSGAEQKRP